MRGAVRYQSMPHDGGLASKLADFFGAAAKCVAGGAKRLDGRG